MKKFDVRLDTELMRLVAVGEKVVKVVQEGVQGTTAMIEAWGDPVSVQLAQNLRDTNGITVTGFWYSEEQNLFIHYFRVRGELTEAILTALLGLDAFTDGAYVVADVADTYSSVDGDDVWWVVQKKTDAVITPELT